MGGVSTARGAQRVCAAPRRATVTVWSCLELSGRSGSCLEVVCSCLELSGSTLGDVWSCPELSRELSRELCGAV